MGMHVTPTLRWSTQLLVLVPCYQPHQSHPYLLVSRTVPPLDMRLWCIDYCFIFSSFGLPTSARGISPE